FFSVSLSFHISPSRPPSQLFFHYCISCHVSVHFCFFVTIFFLSCSVFFLSLHCVSCFSLPPSHPISFLRSISLLLHVCSPSCALSLSLSLSFSLSLSTLV